MFVAVAAAAGGRPMAAPDRPAEPVTFSLKGWRGITLGFERPPLASAEARLETREGKHPASGKRAVIFTTRSRATLLGARGFEEETTSYIDPESNRPIELDQLRPGDSSRTYTFQGTSIQQTVRQPAEGESAADPETWSLVESAEKTPSFSNGDSPDSDDWITDFYSLIAILGRADRQSHRAREFVTLYRRHLVRVRVTPGETRTVERAVVDESTGERRTVTLRERRLTITPLGEDADSFRGLLGMRGETEFWVEEGSGAPVEITGSAPVIGQVKVSLRSFLTD